MPVNGKPSSAGYRYRRIATKASSESRGSTKLAWNEAFDGPTAETRVPVEPRNASLPVGYATFDGKVSQIASMHSKSYFQRLQA